MRKISFVLPVVLSMMSAGISFAGGWNLVKNVQRLEWVSPDYKDNKEIDKKFLDVLDLTEKTRKEEVVYEEAKKIAGRK